jgi:hypothetical protein
LRKKWYRSSWSAPLGAMSAMVANKHLCPLLCASCCNNSRRSTPATAIASRCAAFHHIHHIHHIPHLACPPPPSVYQREGVPSERVRALSRHARCGDALQFGPQPTCGAFLLFAPTFDLLLCCRAPSAHPQRSCVRARAVLRNNACHLWKLTVPDKPLKSAENAFRLERVRTFSNPGYVSPHSSVST